MLANSSFDYNYKFIRSFTYEYEPKNSGFPYFVLLLEGGWLKSAIAADEVEHILQKTITSTTLEYLSGREGDPTAMKGFAIESTFGLSSGTGVVNFFAGTGEMTEVFRIRTGF